MLKFHPLCVVGRTEIADDAVALTLALPPGLRELYRFQAGQHVAVRAVIAGREERRTYSIVSPEGAAALQLGVRIQSNGLMSEYLGRGLRIGDALEVLTPNGSFHARATTPRARRLVAFAAGSGITPVLSIAASALAADAECRFQLYYGNTNTARTMFLEEVLALKDRFLPRFSVCFFMSREPQEIALFNGRLDAAKLRELARHDLDVHAAEEYFICGPGSMAADLQSALAGLGAAGPVHVEHFVAAEEPIALPAAGVATPAPPAASAQAPSPETAQRPAADRATVTVVMDGRRRTFTMARDGDVILDAAADAGLDLPFSCRSGVCSTCRARLVSGTATMQHNVALEDWEVEAGYILCCQARPTSPALELSYDE